MKKTVKKIVIVLVLVIVALVGTIGFTWKDEICLLYTSPSPRD